MITREFILAGQATFTVSNPQGVHYTFRVAMSGTAHFAAVLTGSDNERSYTYAGIVNAVDGSLRATGASRIAADAESWKVLAWALRRIWRQDELPQGYEIRHAGKCGRCGRVLTTPESIESGLGPTCRARQGE